MICAWRAIDPPEDGGHGVLFLTAGHNEHVLRANTPPAGPVVPVLFAQRLAVVGTLAAERAASALRETAHEVADSGRDTALRLTSVALLLRPMGPWYVRAPILGLAILTLASGGALRRSEVWLALSGLIAMRIASDWPLADNHIYLLSYWCLAAGLTLRRGAPEGALAWNARWLIGLAFACAVVWKLLLSPDFVDGRFFRVTLQTDPRFADVAQIVGGLTGDELAANGRALEPVPEGAELLDPPSVVEPRALRRFARLSTWGIVFLEAAVAALMLIPLAAPAALAGRHAALLLFCVTTYAFAPVAGFGWLLLVMGIAQVAARQTWLRGVYVGAFLLTLFYSEVPWAGLLLDALRR